MRKPILRNRLTAHMKVRYTALRKRVIKSKTAFVKKYQKFCMSLRMNRLHVEEFIFKYKKILLNKLKSIYQPVLIEIHLAIGKIVRILKDFLKKIHVYYLASGKGSFVDRQNKSIQRFYRRLNKKSNRNARYWYLHIKIDSLSDIIGYIILFIVLFVFYFVFFILFLGLIEVFLKYFYYFVIVRLFIFEWYFSVI